MILAIDIGNTTVGICGVERVNTQYSVRFTKKLETIRDWDSLKYLEQVRIMMHDNQIKPEEFEGAVISSVVPSVQNAMTETIRKIFNMEPMIITCESDLGIAIGVLEPDKVGRDRLVDSAWAAANYALPVVTVDLGTATTFNVISEEHVLIGGVITAGMLTGLRALYSKTAQLPKLDLKKPERIIGRNTNECMLSGAVAGTAAILDGIVRDIEEELGKNVSMVITGGGAPYVNEFVRHPHVYEPDMILKGLAYLYDRNKEK